MPPTMGSTRLVAVDRLRGLIMAVMAIDHASSFIARVHPAETWAAPPPYYSTLAAFLTRWPTHLCAPGFFFLMGIGMVWFADARRQIGWTDARIRRYFLTRGLVLLVVQHLVENPAWLLGEASKGAGPFPLLPPFPGESENLLVGLAVLSALGIAMVFWSFWLRASVAAVAAVSAAALFASAWMTPDPSMRDVAIPVIQRLLFVPGQTGVLLNVYPWVAWLTPAGAGIIAGRFWLNRATRIPTDAAATGAALVAVFAGLRSAGLGDPFPALSGPIAWLSVTKYPPSPAFFALTIGLNLWLLAGLARFGGRWAALLEAFGRTPFFFYLAHLWLFGLLSFAFPQGASLAVTYAVWAAVMVSLYPVCVWYSRFKNRQPQRSFWRFF